MIWTNFSQDSLNKKDLMQVQFDIYSRLFNENTSL